MASGSPVISVVLLSHNRPETLPRALESVLKQTHQALEVIVVDNPSPRSPELAAIVAAHPGVRLIRTERNLGFAGGINVGIAAATGAYTYITEDDMLLAPDCLERLLEHLQRSPDVGFATAMLLDEATGNIQAAGGEVSLGPVFKVRIFGTGERDTGQFAQPFNTSYVLGGMLLAETRFLHQLRGFRDEFVLYYEDLELCLRATAAGKKLAVVPAAKATHLVTPRHPASLPVEFHRIKNLFAVYLLHARWSAMPGFVARFGGMDFLRALRRNRARAWTHLRSAAWLTANLPRLLAERWLRSRPRSPLEWPAASRAPGSQGQEEPQEH